MLLWIIESLGPEHLQRRLQDLPADDADRACLLLAGLQRDPQAADDREHLDALAQTSLPYLVSCGWNDLFVEGAIELFETVIGPWSHGNPSDWQGDVWLGYAASRRAAAGATAILRRRRCRYCPRIAYGALLPLRLPHLARSP